MGRSIATFVIALLVGALVSLSISLNLVLFILACSMALLIGLWLRSWAALCGELIGFGSVWLVVIGSGYVRCRDSGACIGHENMVPFIAIASVVLVFGALVGLVGVARWRDRRSAF